MSVNDQDPWAPPAGQSHGEVSGEVESQDIGASNAVNSQAESNARTEPVTPESRPRQSVSSHDPVAERQGGGQPEYEKFGDQDLGKGSSQIQRSQGRGGTVAIAIAAGLVAGLVGGFGGVVIHDQISSLPSRGGDEAISLSGGQAPPAQEGSVAAIAEETLPSVVSLEVSGNGVGASGSGFIFRSDGYIVTNNHVIAPAIDGGEVSVTFSDGSRAPGKIVGRSASYDLGLVKVKKKNLPSVTLGNSDAIRVGDPVVAIGSPLGLNGTVTKGIVSAIDRPVTAGGQQDQSFISAIQTDAAINPGNSGGPLLDSAGRVIGINSAIATIQSRVDRSGSIGLGFAIPINQAKRVAEEIISTGKSRTPIIGVSLDTSFARRGAKVLDVTPGGPAAAAGIEPGDVIVSINGDQVADANEVIVAIRKSAPGDEITVGIKGKGEVELELGVSDN